MVTTSKQKTKDGQFKTLEEAVKFKNAAVMKVLEKAEIRKVVAQ